MLHQLRRHRRILHRTPNSLEVRPPSRRFGKIMTQGRVPRKSREKSSVTINLLKHANMLWKLITAEQPPHALKRTLLVIHLYQLELAGTGNGWGGRTEAATIVVDALVQASVGSGTHKLYAAK